MLVAYLNNPSEEAIFDSNRIKEQHETMKLQNEEVMPGINRPGIRNFSEKSYLYLTVSYSILSINIDIVKIFFYVLHNKVALLTHEMF